MRDYHVIVNGALNILLQLFSTTSIFHFLFFEAAIKCDVYRIGLQKLSI